MPIFNKAPDYSDLLHRILREIAELRQQINAQQHAADQAHQHANAAVNTGLAEIRQVVREGLNRANDNLRDPLANISTELVTIRADINNLNRRQPTPGPSPAQNVAVPQPQPQPQPQPDRTGTEEPARQDTDGPARRESEASARQERGAPAGEDEDSGEHRALLRKAAGISVARLEVHRDTWAFLVEHAGQDRHFHIPGAVDEVNGTVTVNVSGPSLVASLTSLRDLRQVPGTDSGTVAIAEHIYERVANTARSLVTTPRPGAEPVRIVIDDRIAGPDHHNQPSLDDEP